MGLSYDKDAEEKEEHRRKERKKTNKPIKREGRL